MSIFPYLEGRSLQTLVNDIAIILEQHIPTIDTSCNPINLGGVIVERDGLIKFTNDFSEDFIEQFVEALSESGYDLDVSVP